MYPSLLDANGLMVGRQMGNPVCRKFCSVFKKARFGERCLSWSNSRKIGQL